MKKMWHNFILLLWKNWLIQKRHKKQILIELLLPIILIGVLVIIRSLTDPEVLPEDIIYDEFDISKFSNLTQNMSIDNTFWKNRANDVPYVNKIIYSPISMPLESIFYKTDEALKTTSVPVKTPDIVESTVFNDNYLAGLAISRYNENSTFVFGILTYNVRFPSEFRRYPLHPILLNWRTNILYPLFPTTNFRNPNENYGAYYVENMLTVFHHVNKYSCERFRFYYNKDFGPILLEKVVLRRFPIIAHTQDDFLGKLQMALSFLILFSYIVPILNTVKFITLEKEKQLTDIMRIMGIDYWIHWLAWFIRSMVLLTIVNCLVILLLKISWLPNSELSVLTYSSTTVLCAFFTIYSMAITTYCFMMSVFFSKAKSAMCMAGVVWLMSYFPYMVTQGSFYEMGFLYKLFICLFQNSTMGLHFKMLIIHEGTTEGLQWHNIFKPVTSRDDFTIGCAWIMMVVDSLLYLIIALYLEKLMPNDIDEREHRWNFIFKNMMVKSVVNIDNNECDESVKPEYQKDDDRIESVTGDQIVGIEIKNLRKIYDNNVAAVDGLTMNVYEDQITILLGYKGAGKTTTISMLAGMIRPTSGTAIINGKDLRVEFNKTRGSLGLCLQHNILFDELTVLEHIIFFCKLKGLNNSQIREDVSRYIYLLKLENNINTPSSSLTEGVKRKLSVALALCGESKVVLCDEPTIGLDPSTRQIVWDVLQQEKICRTVLISTCIIEEADFLGDRIAVISNGVMKCYGSSFYLKKKIGIGYRLICVKTEKCQTDELTTLIQRYIPNSELESDIGYEVVYKLSESFINIYSTMLLALEDHQLILGISTFGMSYTNLEDVCNIVSNDEPQEVCEKCFGCIPELETKQDYSSSISEETLLLNKNFLSHHIKAMFLKKFFFLRNTFYLSILYLLIPIAFILLALSVSELIMSGTELPPMPMSIKSYQKPIIMLHIDPSYKEGSHESNAFEGCLRYLSIFRYASYEIIAEDLGEHMIQLQKENFFKATEQYLAGIDIKKDKVCVYFNNQPYHMAPTAMMIYYNCINEATLPKLKYIVTFINHPIPFQDQSRVNMLEKGNSFGFALATSMGFAMSFVGAFNILFYIKERECYSKLLQFMNGINVLTFWITAFLWDLLTFAIACVVIAGTLFMLKKNGFSTWTEIGFCSVLSFTFGWAILPLNYLASMLFKIPLIGFTFMLLFNIITGVTFFFTTFLLTENNYNNTKNVADIMLLFRAVSPNLLLTQGFYRINLIGGYKEICNDACKRIGTNCTFEHLCNYNNKTYCCDLDYFKWSEPGIFSNILYLFITGLILFFIVIIKEIPFFSGPINVTKNNYSTQKIEKCYYIDKDVLTEKKAIAKIIDDQIINNYSLIVNEYTKHFEKLTAVNSVSVALQNSECFGILGSNGAGKTTFLKMLIGNTELSEGNAWFNGMNSKTAKYMIYRDIAYCPQIDPLIEDLTGRETLNIYCLLRGAPQCKVNDITTHLASNLNFLHHIDKKVAEYSADTKRKLSITLALIGFPSLIILDEPTTGMDIKSKRNFWNVINTVQNMGRAILLATNYINECEALCTQIAIMVNGKFNCIGSSQYLKNRFSPGFTLIIKALNPLEGNRCLPTNLRTLKATVRSIKKYMKSYFIEATLKDEFEEFLTYFISGKEKWSTMFATMEVARSKVLIDDYAIIQITLEQLCQSMTIKQNSVSLI